MSSPRNEGKLLSPWITDRQVEWLVLSVPVNWEHTANTGLQKRSCCNFRIFVVLSGVSEKIYRLYGWRALGKYWSLTVSTKAYT